MFSSLLLVTRGNIMPPVGTTIVKTVLRYHTDITAFFLLSDNTVKVIGEYNGTVYEELHDIWLVNITDIYWTDAGLDYNRGSLSSSIFFKTNSNTLKALGNNVHGQLGIGSFSFTDTETPTDVVGVSNVDKVIALKGRTYFLLNDGSVKAAGRKEYWLLLNGESSGISTTAIDCTLLLYSIWDIGGTDNSTTIAYANTSWLKSIGSNTYGALWDWTFTNSFTSFVDVDLWIEGLDVLFFSNGPENLFIHTNSHTYWVGWNAFWVLGLGDTTHRNVPTMLGHNFSKVVSTNRLVIGLKVNELYYAWRDSIGQAIFPSSYTFSLLRDDITDFTMSAKDTGTSTTSVLVSTISWEILGIGSNSWGQLWTWDATTKTVFTNSVGIIDWISIINVGTMTLFQETWDIWKRSGSPDYTLSPILI